MKTRLLDLFCGAGGAAVGYHRAGFDVVGVDLAPQPNYPFEFIQADALDVLRSLRALGYFGWTLDLPDISAIHASPPCQRYSHALKTSSKAARDKHPDLIAPTQALLKQTGLSYVIENVEGARSELHDPVLLCGSMFNLHVRRHRLFECNLPILVPNCAHELEREREQKYLSTRLRSGERRLRGIVNAHATGARWNSDALAEAMEIDWMSPAEVREAIPPAYTELIGHQLMQHITTSRQVA